MNLHADCSSIFATLKLNLECDAEKVFDNLNWVFLFKVLEVMDFGGEIYSRD